MPTPSRQYWIFIHPGSGLTHKNLNRLEYLSRVRNNIAHSGYNSASNHNRELRNQENVIYAEIANKGHHNGITAARGFVAPYINKLRRLKRKVTHNNEGNEARNLVRQRTNKGWERFQAAAGRFKKGGLTRIQLRELAEALGGGHNAHLLATLVRGQVSPGSPIRRTRAQYNAAIERERRRVRNAERQRSAAAIRAARQARARVVENQARSMAALRSAARAERASRRGR
jgi:hypothetical protein